MFEETVLCCCDQSTKLTVPLTSENCHKKICNNCDPFKIIKLYMWTLLNLPLAFLTLLSLVEMFLYSGIGVGLCTTVL